MADVYARQTGLLPGTGHEASRVDSSIKGDALLFDFQAGELVEVPHAEVDNALRSGRYGVRKGQAIDLIGPDGKLQKFSADKVPDALGKGFKYGGYSETDRASIQGMAEDSPVTAGLLAARGTFDFGVGDQLRGDRENQYRKALREENPIADLAGSAAGGIAATLSGPGRLLASGGLALGAKAASGVSGGVARGLTQGAVAAGLEGAAFGGGNLLTEEALGETELTADSVLAYVGGGALLGAGVGGVMGGLAPLMRSGAGKLKQAVLTKTGAGEFAREVAEESAIDSLGLTGATRRKLVKRLGEKRYRQMGRSLLDAKLDDGSPVIRAGLTAEDNAERLGRYIDTKGRVIGETYDQLDDAILSGGVGPDVAPRPKVVAKKLRDWAKQYEGSSAYRSVMQWAKQEADNLDSLDGKLWSFKGAQTERRGFRKAWRADREDLTGLNEGRRKLERLIKEEMEAGLERAPDDLLGEGWRKSWREANDEVAALAQLGDEAADRAAMLGGNRLLSLSDNMAALGGLGSQLAQGASVVDGGATALAMGFGHKLIRERGRSVMARMLDKVSKLDALGAAADETNKRLESALARFLKSAETGSRAAFSTGITVPTLGLEAPRAFLADAGDVKAESKRLAELVSNPEAMATQVAASLADVESAAPGISTAMASKAAEVATYLHSRAPKPPKGAQAVLQPKIDDWKPSAIDVAKYSRIRRAALDPVSVIEDLGAGRVTREAAEVLRDLYPKLYERAQQKLLESMHDLERRLPYADRVQISLLFDIPLDATMEPGFIARQQQAFTTKPTSGQAGGGQRITGIAKLDLAGRMKTSVQGVEER